MNFSFEELKETVLKWKILLLFLKLHEVIIKYKFEIHENSNLWWSFLKSDLLLHIGLTTFF